MYMKDTRCDGLLSIIPICICQEKEGEEELDGGSQGEKKLVHTNSSSEHVLVFLLYEAGRSVLLCIPAHMHHTSLSSTSISLRLRKENNK